MPSRKFVRNSGVIVLIGVAALSLPLLRRPAPVAGELRRADLTLTDGKLFPTGGGEPFTGIMFEQTSTGQRLSAIPVREGVIEGVAYGWHENGQKEVEETFAAGVSNGIRTRWYPDGKKKSEATIVKGELQGAYTEWHENGQVAIRMNLDHGKPDGLCEAWNPDGSRKSSVMQDHGKIVKQEFFPAKKEEVAAK